MKDNPVYSYPDEVARKWKHERDLLRDALAGLWMHIHNGTLVRETNSDGHDNWIIQVSALVTDLKRAKDALTATE